MSSPSASGLHLRTLQSQNNIRPLFEAAIYYTADTSRIPHLHAFAILAFPSHDSRCSKQRRTTLSQYQPTLF